MINNKGCRIPDFDPVKISDNSLIGKAKPINCKYGTHLPLIDSNNSAIFVNQKARNHYYNGSENIDCYWRAFWRKEFEDDDVM